MVQMNTRSLLHIVSLLVILAVIGFMVINLLSYNYGLWLIPHAIAGIIIFAVAILLLYKSLTRRKL